MNYTQFHQEFIKLAPKKKGPMVDRIIPTDRGGKNLNIRIPRIKNFANKFSKKYKPTFAQAVNLADQIFYHKITEEVAFAIELTAKYKEGGGLDFWPRATGWIKFLTNWENCDRLCGRVLGKILLANPQLIYQLKKWAKDKFYWQRRCAAVAFIPALSFEGRAKLYKKSGAPRVYAHGIFLHPSLGGTRRSFAKEGKFIKPCLQICAQLGKDKEMYVQKAVGWPIREITKWGGRDITYHWLIKNKNNLSSFVWHAALEKFPPKDKNKLKLIYKKYARDARPHIRK